MITEKITPNFEVGTLVGRGALLIILGVIIGILINSSWVGALTVTAIPATICAILLIFLGIALLCGGASLGGVGGASVILGVIVIILGIVALFNTAAFEAFLVYFLAASALISGIFNLISGITDSMKEKRVPTIVAGIIGIILGIIIFVAAFNLTPWITAVFIVYAAAIFMVIYGIISIIQAILIKKATNNAGTA